MYTNIYMYIYIYRVYEYRKFIEYMFENKCEFPLNFGDFLITLYLFKNFT